MKLHFEPDLDYQKLAIESVADLFRGQDVFRRAVSTMIGKGSHHSNSTKSMG
jgi:hypothetical protein